MRLLSANPIGLAAHLNNNAYHAVVFPEPSDQVYITCSNTLGVLPTRAPTDSTHLCQRERHGRGREDVLMVTRAVVINHSPRKTNIHRLPVLRAIPTDTRPRGGPRVLHRNHCPRTLRRPSLRQSGDGKTICPPSSNGATLAQSNQTFVGGSGGKE